MLQRIRDLLRRARRSEYWWFSLLYFLIYVPGYLLSIVSSNSVVKGFGVLVMVVVFLGMFVPLLAANVRRLHDTGRSGWWYLLNLVPFGSLVVLVFMVQDSNEMTNNYGPNPKAPAAPVMQPYV